MFIPKIIAQFTAQENTRSTLQWNKWNNCRNSNLYKKSNLIDGEVKEAGEWLKLGLNNWHNWHKSLMHWFYGPHSMEDLGNFKPWISMPPATFTGMNGVTSGTIAGVLFTVSMQ